MSTGSKRRTTLDRPRILQAAIEHADSHGIDTLSMRSLAKTMGCGAMSLYNHVANKDDLLEGMAEAVAAEVEPLPPGLEWKDAIGRLAEGVRGALLRHPWAVPLWTSAFPGPNRFRHMEQLLELIARGGLEGQLADVAFHAVNHHVIGFTQQQLAYQTSADEWAEVTTRFDEEVHEDDFPLVVAHKHYHDKLAEGAAQHPNEFRLVLDLILEGLERTARNAGPHAATPATQPS
jgi:AcrR family transcriptional regulator